MSRRRNRRLFLLVLIAGMAAFSSVWYASQREEGSGTPEFGGQYVEGIIGTAGRINPLFGGLNDADQTINALVFAGLTRLDGQGRPYPDLADTWEASPDGLSFTFKLRPGLVWQDGAPLTADDVQFTFLLLQDPAVGASPALPGPMARAGIVVLDPLTVRFVLDEPFSALPSYLSVGLVPRHLLAATEPAALVDAPFNQRPIGAGPYRLVELTPQQAVLDANLASHMGRPFIPRFEVRFFTSSQALFAALEGGHLDGAYFATGLSQAEAVRIEQDRLYRTYRLESGEVTFVYLNLARPVMEDRRVRQALLYALDREAIAEAVYGDAGGPAGSPLPNGVWSEASTLDRYGTDQRAAMLLLDEAGWRADGSGIRSRNGVPLALTLTTNPDPVHVATAESVARQWQQVGITASVTVKGSTELVRDTLGPRNFDALLFEQPAAPDPDPYAYWHSNQATIEGFNLASLRNVRIDEVLAQARATTQQLTREELYSQFQELFAQEVPSIPLYSSRAIYVQRQTIKDAQPGIVSRPGDRFWQVIQWYVKVK